MMDKINNIHDFPTLVRLLAITLIVASHFEIFKYGGGGSELLMLMVGYNIAKFKLKSVLDLNSPKPIIDLVIKVVIPTVGYLLLLQIYHDSIMWSSILLISNFFDVRHPLGFSYWFINVYVQILLFIFICLSFSFIRDLIKKDTKRFSFILVVFSILIYIIIEGVWDTDYLYRRVPHAMFWMFAFGFAARFVDDFVSKIYLSILFSFMTYIYFEDIISFFYFFSMMLIWDVRITIPSPIKKLIFTLSLSSLFIYLTHFQVRSVVEKILPDQPIVYLVSALIVGAAINVCYTKIYKYSKTRFT